MLVNFLYRESKSVRQLNKMLYLKQVDLYTQTIEDYSKLLQEEQQLFNSGKSTLFMVNLREISYINTRPYYMF